MNHNFFFSIFISIAVIVLLSPLTANPLASPITNGSYIPDALAEVQLEIGKNYDRRLVSLNPDGSQTYMWVSHPERILDGNTYKDYKLVEDQTSVKLETANAGSIIFNKNTCTYDLYNAGLITQDSIPQVTGISWTVKGKLATLETWSNVGSINNAICSVSVESTPETVTVTGSKTSSAGTFQIVLYYEPGGGIKETMRAYNNNPLWDNHHVGITETIGVPTIIKLGDKEYDLSKHGDLVLGRNWIEANKAKLLKFSNSLFYDFGIGFDNLNDVKILWDGSQAKLALNYLFVDSIVPYQTWFEVDPTFGYTAGTTREISTGAAADNTCPGPYTADATQARVVKVSDGQCIRFATQWDISSLANGITVTNVTLRYDISSVSSPRNCDYMPMLNTIAIASRNNFDLFQDIGNGTAYVSNDASCTTAATNYVEILGSSAHTDVQNALTNDRWLLGFKLNDETQDGVSHRSAFDQTAVELQITYNNPPTQQVRFRLLENDGVSSVASASITLRNSTTSDTKTTNATGVTGIFGLSLSTNHNVTAKTTENYVVYKQFNWQPTANTTEVRSARIFDVSGCLGTIGDLMTNDTDRHYVASVPLTPSCSSELLTWNYFYSPLGIGPSPSNQTTTVRMEVPEYYCRTQTVYVNGSAVSMTCASNVLTSGTIQVGTGNQNVILKFRLTFLARAPNAVNDLTSPDQSVATIDLRWTQPDLHGFSLLGYQINYTTPWSSNPATRLVNNTNSSTVTYTVSGLAFATQYSFRVSAWTLGGNNATGNILNATTEGDTFTVSAIVLNQTNTDIVDIRFERDDINDTATFINVTYPDTFDLDCNVYTKFARTNTTYTNLSNVTIDSDYVESSFRFINVDREIIDIACWNSDTSSYRSAISGNSTHTGTYVLSQTQFPLLDQINNFRAGTYGTQGKFGVFDFVTLAVVIISMIGFNRVNETVGAVFNIILLGTLAYFEIIVLPTIIFGAIATIMVLIISSTRKD